ncbi:hypothetical protein K8I85_16085 [bacterium]|nr:hypothetical protein [bacterium]
MRLNSLRTAPSRARLAAVAAATALTLTLVLLLAGCSNDGPVPVCYRCEFWDQLTVGLARFADPHPTIPNVYVYSTIQKSETASDSQREADEDIWVLLVRDPSDPTQNVAYQVTGDEVSTSGDNFAPRWSPDGTQIVFAHSRDTGGIAVWRVGLDASALAADTAPTIGTPEMIASSGRDPEWLADDEILFTDGDKLFRQFVALLPAPAGGGGGAEQLSFGPPIFASSEKYLDRHPDVEDGAAIFNTTGRKPVGNIYVSAVEPDSGNMDPRAFLLLQSPGTVGTYPLVEGADTLRTPALIRALPLDNGNTYVVGAKLDPAFYPQPDSGEVGRQTYCDTLFTQVVELEAGQTDSVMFRFEQARGSLRIRTGMSQTAISWTRADSLVTSKDFGGNADTGELVLENVNSSARFDCLPSYEAEPHPVFGHVFPDTTTRETYLIRATRFGGVVETQMVTIDPGDTTLVDVFTPPGPGREAAGPAPVVYASNAPPRNLRGGQLAAGFRAEGDISTIWQVDFSGAEVGFREFTGAPGLIQTPALTREFAGRVRYMAYVSDESGLWKLYIQPLLVDSNDQLVENGDRIAVETPGTLDNLSCDREVFYPRFLPTSTAEQLEIVVAMADCPGNGFEHLGFDDEPWAIGEYRVWKARVVIP